MLSKLAITWVFTLVILLVPVSVSFAKKPGPRDISKIGPVTAKVELANYKTVLYVSINTGSDKSGKGSQEKPWRTLRFAFSKILDADESNRYAILVAAGVYRSGSVELKDHVDIFGGFSAATWQRDIFQHATVLDGERTRRVVIGANNARIDGFTITRGVARSHGGGILCRDTSPVISNNFITDNLVLQPDNFDYDHMYQDGSHGGGIACLYNAVPQIRNNIIQGNKTAIGVGGGVAFYGFLRIDGIEEPVLKDNFLTGGLQAVLENNVIFNNVSGVNDLQRSRSSSGGGVACAYEARPLIRNNIIANNRAKGRSDAGGIYSEFYSYPVIEGNWILGNVSDDDGGGFYGMRMGQSLIKANIFAGNWTTGGGVGGLRLSKEGRAKIEDNLIVQNQSGGGVQCIDSYMELVGNTIMHNKGGGALSYLMRFNYFSPSVVRNNILRENEEKPITVREDLGKPMLLENNNIEGRYEGKDNFDKKTDFVKDGIKGNALKATFDPVHHTTIIELADPIKRRDALPGRVVRLGQKWGVITEAGARNLVVYGDLSFNSRDEIPFEIIPSYSKR